MCQRVGCVYILLARERDATLKLIFFVNELLSKDNVQDTIYLRYMDITVHKTNYDSYTDIFFCCLEFFDLSLPRLNIGIRNTNEFCHL